MGDGDRMAASGDGPSYGEMREAMERYVRERGLRRVSREIGMSAPSMDNLVRGARRPSAQTARKVRQWFLRRRMIG